MRLDELIWDEWNEEHIARHRVAPEEVEEVVFDPASWVRRTRGSTQRRYVILGVTEAGRHLVLVLEPQGAGRAYPVTARDMTSAEKRRYRSR